MGATQAADMAQAVADEDMNLTAALSYHLQHNHYPPLPLSCNALAARVINYINDGGEGDEEFRLPNGIESRTWGKDVPAYVIIEEWHLYHFIEEGEYCG